MTSIVRPAEIPSVANQKVLVELLRVLPRPWSAAVFNASELLAIAYAPRSQWPHSLGLKVERLLAAQQDERPSRRSPSFPRVAEWLVPDAADRLPPVSRPGGLPRRHCLTLVIGATQDREDAEKWPDYIRALLVECSGPGTNTILDEAGNSGHVAAVVENPAGRTASPASQSALDRLDAIEEGLSYVLECLVQEFTGEAKGELHKLIATVETTETIETTSRSDILGLLRGALGRLRSDSYDSAARAGLVTLRRRLRETRRALQSRASGCAAIQPLSLWASDT